MSSRKTNLLTMIILCVLLLIIIDLQYQVVAQEVEALMALSLADIFNMDVTVASKSTEKLSDAPGVISVVTKDDLENPDKLYVCDCCEQTL